MFYTWALGNLVLSFLNVLFALAALVIITFFLLVDYDRKSIVGPSVTFAIGIVSIMVFLVGSDMRLPMTMINYKTVLHIVILAIQSILMILAIVRMPVYKQKTNQLQHYPYQQPDHSHNFSYQHLYPQQSVPLLHAGIDCSVPGPSTDSNAKEHI